MKTSTFKKLIQQIIKEEHEKIVLNQPSSEVDSKQQVIAFIKYALNPQNNNFDVSLKEIHVVNENYYADFSFEGFKDFKFNGTEITINIEGVVKVSEDYEDMDINLHEMSYYVDGEIINLGNLITPEVEQELLNKLFTDDLLTAVESKI